MGTEATLGVAGRTEQPWSERPGSSPPSTHLPGLLGHLSRPFLVLCKKRVPATQGTFEDGHAGPGEERPASALQGAAQCAPASRAGILGARGGTGRNGRPVLADGHIWCLVECDRAGDAEAAPTISHTRTHITPVHGLVAHHTQPLHTHGHTAHTPACCAQLPFTRTHTAHSRCHTRVRVCLLDFKVHTCP